jgi:hypothetical protein
VPHSWKARLAAGAIALGAVAVALASWAAYARDGHGPLAGRWKVVMLDGSDEVPLAVLRVGAKDGKPAAELLSATLPDTELADVRAGADGLHFTLRAPSPRGPLAFEAAAYPPGGESAPARLAGSAGVRGVRRPLWLERTDKDTLDARKDGRTTPGFADLEKAEEARDPAAAFRAVLKGQRDRPVAVLAGQILLRLLAKDKAPADDVRAAADDYLKAAAPYGREMEADALAAAARAAASAGHPRLALDYAERAEKKLADDDPPALAAAALKPLARALRDGGRAAEADAADGRVAALEGKLDEEYLRAAVPFKPERYAGRKGRGDRVVLAELFTGAQCPPCVAADIAFDALLQTYKPSQAVLLQYHLHVPGPDPLTNPDSEARAEYYGSAVEGTPAYLIDGQAGPPAGGYRDDGKEVYGALRKVIDAALESPAGARLTLAARRAGDAVELRAEVSGLKTTGEKVRLRLVLAEDVVRYPGPNGQRLHHHVVRAFPGGVAGFPLTEASARRTETVRLSDLARGLRDYLDAAAKENPFPDDERPLALKRLKAVAFIQDDATKEVLQAAQADVPEAD